MIFSHGVRYQLICAGVVISSLEILTAAHCFDNRDQSKILILTNLEEIPDKSGHPRDWEYPWHEVKNIKIHEGYKLKG